MIAETRSGLVAQLTEVGVPVHNLMPDDFEPPGLIVYSPTDGVYIGPGQFRSTYEIAFDVVIAVANMDSQNDENVAIDNLIELVLENTMNWGLRSVDAVGLVNIQGNSYPGTAVHIAIQKAIGE